MSKSISLIPYRKMFIGGTKEEQINSDLIRNLKLNQPASINTNIDFVASIGDV
jgi:hypothetical protein